MTAASSPNVINFIQIHIGIARHMTSISEREATQTIRCN